MAPWPWLSASLSPGGGQDGDGPGWLHPGDRTLRLRKECVIQGEDPAVSSDPKEDLLLVLYHLGAGDSLGPSPLCLQGWPVPSTSGKATGHLSRPLPGPTGPVTPAPTADRCPCRVLTSPPCNGSPFPRAPPGIAAAGGPIWGLSGRENRPQGHSPTAQRPQSGGKRVWGWDRAGRDRRRAWGSGETKHGSVQMETHLTSVHLHHREAVPFRPLPDLEALFILGLGRQTEGACSCRRAPPGPEAPASGGSKHKAVEGARQPPSLPFSDSGSINECHTF